MRPQRHRVVAWKKENGYGVELVDVKLDVDRLAADGVAIGWHPLPYRLEFSLDTAPGWVTSRLQVTTKGDGWSRSLDLRRSKVGAWTVTASASGDADLQRPGGDAKSLAGAVDCDLALCPLTNSMPVLRHEFLRNEGSVDFLMAWVSVPDLSVHAVAQRYTSLGDEGDSCHHVEYRAMDRGFVSELLFDADGLVLDYPKLAKLVA